MHVDNKLTMVCVCNSLRPLGTPCEIEVRATGKHYDGILSNVKAKKVSQSPENRTCDNLAAPILVDTIRIRI